MTDSLSIAQTNTAQVTNVSLWPEIKWSLIILSMAIPVFWMVFTPGYTINYFSFLGWKPSLRLEIPGEWGFLLPLLVLWFFWQSQPKSKQGVKSETFDDWLLYSSIGFPIAAMATVIMLSFGISNLFWYFFFPALFSLIIVFLSFSEADIKNEENILSDQTHAVFGTMIGNMTAVCAVLGISILPIAFISFSGIGIAYLLLFIVLAIC